MRKSIANALLCLLVLLSVGTLRCEVRCFGSAASMAMQPMSQMDDTLTMHAGMAHCDGMMHAHGAGVAVTAVCSSGMCGHQALPASPDTVAELDRATLVAVVALPLHVSVIEPGRSAAWQDAARPPLLRRTPLDLNSTLRV